MCAFNLRKSMLLMCVALMPLSTQRLCAADDLYNPDPSKNPLVLAARKVSDAVVSIGGVETRLYRRRIPQGYYDPFDFFSQFLIYPETAKVPYRGTGFIINENGYVVTNYHVIEGLEKYLVTLPDQREFEAQLLDADKVVDVALLKIDAENLPSLVLGNSDKLMIGEWALAVGNPFGNWIEDPHPTVTVGVISALNRSFNPDSSQFRVYQGMIQTDAAINPGNSGGPLVNIRGEVVGVNTFIFSRVGGSHGIGFAIPINRVVQIVEEILKHGRIRTLWLDLDLINLTPNYARQLQLNSTQGALIRYIEGDGPGSKAGLQVGDVVTAINNRPVRNVDDFAAYFAAQQVGDTIELKYIRGGKPGQTKYVVQEYRQAAQF